MKERRMKVFKRTLSVLFWIIMWQLLATAIKSEILIASPVRVMEALVNMLPKGATWANVYFSFARIMLGFLIAVVSGVILAVAAYYSMIIKELLYIPMTMIKATPVASFIVMALIWISPSALSVFVSFLMGVPIVYTNVLKGMENIDIKMKEMMRVFRVSPCKQLRYLYFPKVMPFFYSAVSISLGMCWKAGIAGEIIGIPKGSMGERLYNAKIFLNTPELFAWTFIIIFVSAVSEKILLLLLKLIQKKVSGE